MMSGVSERLTLQKAKSFVRTDLKLIQNLSYAEHEIVEHDTYARNLDNKPCCGDKNIYEEIISLESVDKWFNLHTTDVASNAIQRLINQSSTIEPAVYQVKSIAGSDGLKKVRNQLRSTLQKGITPSTNKADKGKFNFFQDDELELVSGHPFTDILYKPNPEENTWSAFISSWYNQFMCNSYVDLVPIYKGKELRGIEFASGLERKKEKKGGFYVYTWQEDGKTYTKSYKMDDVYTVRMNNPAKAKYKNLAPVDSVLVLIKMYQKLLEWQMAKLKTDFSGTVVVFKDNVQLHAPAKDRLADEVSMASGVKGLGSVVMSDKIANVVKDFSSREMDFTEARDTLRKEIASFFAVHPILLGTVQATYNNFEQALRLLQESGSIPLIQKIVEHLTPLAQRFYGQSVSLWYDTRNSTSLLVEEAGRLDRMERTERIATVNERRAMINMNDHPDAKIGQLTLFTDYGQTSTQPANQTTARS